MIINTHHLRTVKSFAVELGNQERGEPFTATYIYAIFRKRAAKSSFATEILERYAIVEIDGVKFVIDKKHLDGKQL